MEGRKEGRKEDRLEAKKLHPGGTPLAPGFGFDDTVEGGLSSSGSANPGDGWRLLVLCFPLEGTSERLIERSSGLFVFWL